MSPENECQLRLQIDEAHLQIGILSSVLTEVKMKYKELNTEKLSWEEYAKLLEEKNKALTQKAERLAAENIVLLDKCARVAAISSANLAESPENSQKSSLHTQKVVTASFKNKIQTQQDQSRKLKSSLLEMIGGFTNFASDMRKKQQNLSFGTNNIEDTLIHEFVSWATQQTERLCDRSIIELSKISEYPNFPRWSTTEMQ
ncbi:unnamed protein product [Caenorhabditis nigoni]